MVFEIFRGKQRVYVTEHESCIPPTDKLRQIKAAGHTLKLDGKRYLPPTETKAKGKKK